MLILLLLFSNCRKEDLNEPVRFDKTQTVEQFFKLPANADSEIKALANNLKKQDSLFNFLPKFVAKNGLPVWDKVKYEVSGNNNDIIYYSTKNENSNNKGIFLVPFVDEKTNQVKSYLVVKKYGLDKYAYQLYNKEELKKTKVSKDLERNLIQTQAVFGFFEKTINSKNEIELINPKKTKIKDVDIKFIRNSDAKQKVTSSIGVNGSVCYDVYLVMISYIDYTDGTSIEMIEYLYIGSFCEGDGGGGGGGGGTPPPGIDSPYWTGNWYNYGAGYPDPYAPRYFVDPYDPNDPFSPYPSYPFYPWFGGGGGILTISALEARVNILKDFFGFSDGDKQYLLNHPSIVYDIELSYNSAIIDDDYKEGIRQSMEDLRTGNTLVMNPDNNLNVETNNQRIGGDDTNVYPEYQDQDPWPTINTVIPVGKFVEYRDGINCFVLSQEQIAVIGYEISEYGTLGSTYKINTAVGVSVTEAKKAVGYIKGALLADIPVIVAVDHTPGHPGNPYGKTDHFVVIVGMGTDQYGKYFRFFDNGTTNNWNGPSSLNKLYYDLSTGLISGASSAPKPTDLSYYRYPSNYQTNPEQAGKAKFSVTHVRRSKNK